MEAGEDAAESVITAIEPGRRRGRFNVFVDGDFVAAVGLEVVADLGLRVGRPFSAERLIAVTKAEETRRAVGVALRLLEARARSKGEITAALRRKAYESDIIELCISDLRRIGLLDDAEFGRQWIESRNRSRPKGTRQIRAELMQKGLAREQIDVVLAESTTESELELSRRAIAPKFARSTVPSARDERDAEFRRFAAFLQRRGFGWETVKAALAERYGRIEEDS